MLGILVTILTVIMVVVCLLMSLVVMMQRPKQEGLGAAFGGSLTDRMLGSGTTDFLQKATVYLGVLFFILALTIATMMAWDRNADRLARGEDIKNIAGKAEANAQEAAVPAASPTDAQISVPAPSDLPAPASVEDTSAVDEEATPAAVEGENNAESPAAAEGETNAESPAAVEGETNAESPAASEGGD